MADPREEGTALDIRWNPDGLAPVIVQEADTGVVLMLAWMNAEAVARTLGTGRATYWSRSRAAFWVKGETSGHHQAVVELRVDCDQDALLLRVRQSGAACHTGREGCFYRQVTPDGLRFVPEA
jgi:phosphoribosyl-AMP cyclohydrolase